MSTIDPNIDSAVERTVDGPALEPTTPDGPVMWRWERDVPDPVAELAQELAGGDWFELRVTAAVDQIAEAVAQGLTEIGVPDGPARRALAADVALLGRTVAQAAARSHVLVRVEVNAAEMCPVFHQDANVIRLLCTYAGPGTEWLPEPSVDRSELGLQGRTPADANAAIASGPSRHSLPGEVLILTGSKFDERGVGAIRKSPSAELGSRLFVAIDPLDDDPGCRDGCC